MKNLEMTPKGSMTHPKTSVHPHRYVFVMRLALGIIFTIAGLNGLFNFILSPKISPEGEAFIQSLKQSGFFWSLVNLVETSAGIFLLFGVLDQLAVLALVPITLGIFLFHIFLSPQGAWLAYLVTLLEVLLLWNYRRSLSVLFKAPNYEHTPN